MQHDTVIWTVIGDKNFCAFKHKLPINTKNMYMCKNEYNVTGLCSRITCPLANSKYATIKEENGKLYLYEKSVERAAFPAKLWKKHRLSNKYTTALAQIDSLLEYWSEWQIHKCKQRFTKLTQYLIRLRKIEMTTGQRKLVHINKKVDRRDRSREAKAETAARIESSIKRELLERLKAGTYGDIYNFLPSVYDDMLQDGEEVQEDDDIMEDEEEREVEEDTLRDVEQYIEDEDFSEDLEDFDLDAYDAARRSAQHDDSDDDSDDSDEQHTAGGKRPPRRKQRRVEIEFEQEMEPKRRAVVSSKARRSKN